MRCSECSFLTTSGQSCVGRVLAMGRAQKPVVRCLFRIGLRYLGRTWAVDARHSVLYAALFGTSTRRTCRVPVPRLDPHEKLRSMPRGAVHRAPGAMHGRGPCAMRRRPFVTHRAPCAPCACVSLRSVRPISCVLCRVPRTMRRAPRPVPGRETLRRGRVVVHSAVSRGRAVPFVGPSVLLRGRGEGGGGDSVRIRK